VNKKITFIVIMMTLMGFSVSTLAGGFKQPEPPDDAPETARGTSSRTYCSLMVSNVELTPLIPNESNWGYTTSENPKVWVYIDYKNKQYKLPKHSISGELSLVDKNGDLVTQRITNISIPTISGAFPLDIPNLPESNKRYKWILEIDCNEQANLDVEGHIYKKDIPNLTNLNSQEKIIDYLLKEGIWYDALNEAINFYCQDPRYLKDLLTQENLPSIPKESFNCQDK